MTRTPKRAILTAAAIIAISGAGVFLLTSPATAYSTPPTITFSPEHPGENQLTTITFTCTPGSTTYDYHFTGSAAGGGDMGIDVFDQPLDGNGQATQQYNLEDTWARGSVLQVDIACNVGSVRTSGTSSSYTIPNSGATAVSAARLALSAPYRVTGTCGTTPNVDALQYTLIDPTTNTTVGAVANQPFNGVGTFTINLGSGASQGRVAGQQLTASVTCIAHDGGVDYPASVRAATTSFVADPPVAAPPPSAVPVAAAAATLAATGVDVLPVGLGALALLMFGGMLLMLRRWVRD